MSYEQSLGELTKQSLKSFSGFCGSDEEPAKKGFLSAYRGQWSPKEAGDWPKVTQLAQAHPLPTIAQCPLFLCSNLVSMEEALIQRADPPTLHHMPHIAHLHTYLHTCVHVCTKSEGQRQTWKHSDRQAGSPQFRSSSCTSKLWVSVSSPAHGDHNACFLEPLWRRGLATCPAQWPAQGSLSGAIHFLLSSGAQ